MDAQESLSDWIDRKEDEDESNGHGVHQQANGSNQSTYKTTTDAGHGDRTLTSKGDWDSGAIATNDDGDDENEADYALLLESATDIWLKAFDIDNKRTRDVKDIDKKTVKSLGWRSKIANDNNSEVFLSFHLDDAGDTKRLKIIYQQDKSNESISKYLGGLVQSALKDVGGYDSYSVTNVTSLGREDKPGVPTTHLSVLKNFNTGGPGLLIEFGSIASPDNRKFIKQNSIRIGKAIAIAVYQYFHNGEVPKLSPF